jgi:inosine-uridine nucleoside N-ribohydrolase
VPGNISPVASANLYEDLEVAAMVYASEAPLVQVGLDVCDLVEINQYRLDQIRKADTAVTRLLSAATPCLQAYYPAAGYWLTPTAYATTTSRQSPTPLTRGSSTLKTST